MTSPAPDDLRVDLGARGYDIVTGSGLIERAGDYLLPVLKGRRRVVVITDDNVAIHHLPPLQQALDRADLSHGAITVPAGEGAKSWPVVMRVIDELMALKVDRRTVLLALGGGVVGDLAGFIASITLRGLDFVQIPTTLLAQVDSSVGGKTGINVAAGKNLVGSFHQPILVLTDLATLETLPLRERRSGYAEIAKHAVLGDEAFFGWLEQNGSALIAGDRTLQMIAIRHSCETKAAIVAADEREGGARALLNLGHTFGHALEVETGFGDALLHGEAVAVGMTLAAALSVRLGYCDTTVPNRLAAHLRSVGLPSGLSAVPGFPFDVDRQLAHMALDKKTKDGRLTFILLRRIGQAFIADGVEAAEVSFVLRDLQSVG